MPNQAPKTACRRVETAGTDRPNFLISEDSELALRDLAEGLSAIAILCEEREGDMPEVPGDKWAGLLRTFSRKAAGISSRATFECDVCHHNDNALQLGTGVSSISRGRCRSCG